MGFFLQRPEKEVSRIFFHLGWDSTQETWNMAVYWSFGKNFNILSIDDVNKDWLWNKSCESENFSGLTVLVVEGKLLYLISCLNMSTYIGQTFSLLGDMPFAD